MTKDNARELPTLYTAIRCTGCYTEVSADSDGFHCYVCHIWWPTHDPFSEEQAQFIDEEAKPCNQPPVEDRVRHEGPPRVVGDEKTGKRPHWWAKGAVKQVPVHRMFPCTLPSDHDDDHFFPSDCVFNYYDAEDVLIESGEGA